MSSTSPIHNFFFSRTKSFKSITATTPAATVPTEAEQVENDGLAAAKLFIMGLEVELVKPTLTPLRRRRVLVESGSGTDEDIDERDDDDEESEEETVEGRAVDLERLLDLVVGVSFSHLSSA